MQLNHLPAILGFAAATAAVLAPAPASAATLQLVSGVTSVNLDLQTLSSVGLNLTGSNNTVPPVSSSFLVGFEITPATTFAFNHAGGFTPLGGTIEHTGSVTFNNQLTLGNFSIGFDPQRVLGQASGFFVRDTLTLGAILFDVAVPSRVDLSGSDLTIEGDLLVSPELAGVLGNRGLAGADIGEASINSQAVPEPFTIGGMLLAGSALVAGRRRLAQKTGA